ncbi:NfeD family protein [Corynebacterium epidermidicanis]|uniref:Membrane protein implicated in regulation of membrane protease activity n=1 Tax=Corynebacterium epidermidicanis TaxID=1050174 RepID=A0A0G3GUH6_9CORY|nr:NfeD family protein [Corynebacterium epidermidicanis]AKK03173.1 membrane protein implicated in regulation of membrane protease activity [Corynebacterium epidermidicanis]
MEALIWFIAGLVFAGLELVGGEFSLLLIGTAALMTAGVALTGVPMWVQVAVFAVCAVANLMFVRPILHRHLHRKPALDTSVQALVGKAAEVLEPVSESGGLVRIDGEIWSAKSMLPTELFEEDDRVYVARIDGSTAIVWKDIS